MLLLLDPYCYINTNLFDKNRSCTIAQHALSNGNGALNIISKKVPNKKTVVEATSRVMLCQVDRLINMQKYHITPMIEFHDQNSKRVIDGSSANSNYL